MIALIDYGAGNLASVKKALAALAAIGADVFVPARPNELNSARGIIVPGVGHFGATRALNWEWTKAIRRHVDRTRPLLGICLGMQWLFRGSEEAQEISGLGLICGCCYRLPNSSGLKIPHVGWNNIDIVREAAIVGGIQSGSQVYFTHSYVAPIVDETVAATEHGEKFSSIVQRENVAGVQFHPEKSGEIGLHVLRNFLELAS